MEILITESQLRVLLKEEFSEKIIQQLIDKYKLEDPSEDKNIIRDYILRFDKIKGNVKIENKDIFNYSLHDLRTTLMSFYKSNDVKPKSYKGDSDMDLVYDTDNIKIYRADTRDKCIAYGNGYSFCISSYSDITSYKKYRIEESGTPYFIFNKNLDNTRIDKYTYIDPDHLLVLIIYEIGGNWYDEYDNPHRHNMKSYDEYEDHDIYRDEYSMIKNVGDYYYSISDAKNTGEYYYLSFNSIAKKYPFLKGLEGTFEPVGLQGKDSESVKLEQEANKKFGLLREKYSEYMNGRYGFGFMDSCDVNLLMFNQFKDYVRNDTFIKDLLQSAGNNEQYAYKAIRKDDGLSLCFHYGKKGYDECMKEVKDEIINFGGMRDITDYEIVKCDWPEGYAEYVKDAHRLGTYLLHKKWIIEKE